MQQNKNKHNSQKIHIPVNSPHLDFIALEHTAAVSTTAPHILFCSGFRSTMMGTKATLLQQHCIDKGWGFCRFDYRGHAEYSAKVERYTLKHWLEDTLMVLDYLRMPHIIVGSSMGAWLACLACINRPKQVQGLLTIAAAADFIGEVLWPALNPAQQHQIKLGHSVTIKSPYNLDEPWILTPAFFADIDALSLLHSEQAEQIHCPVLMLHGTDDTDIPWTQSQRLMEKLASQNASLTLIKGADHRLSDESSLQHITNKLDELINIIAT